MVNQKYRWLLLPFGAVLLASSFFVDQANKTQDWLYGFLQGFGVTLIISYLLLRKFRPLNKQ